MTEVKTYKCELRHGGNILHSFPLRGVTDREMLLLKRLHGDDSVINAQSEGTRSFAEERGELFYLARKYANTSDPASGRKLVENIFSIPLLGYETWLDEQEELERMEREEKAEQRQRDAAEYARKKRIEEMREAMGGLQAA